MVCIRVCLRYLAYAKLTLFRLLKQMFEHWFEIIADDILRPLLRNNLKKSPFWLLFTPIILIPKLLENLEKVTLAFQKFTLNI